MGVNVSFNGVNGKESFSLDGVPTGPLARRLGFKPLPNKSHFVPQNLADMLKMPKPNDPIGDADKGKVKLNALDGSPDFLDRKLMPGGGVVATQNGLALKGEEMGPLIPGTKLFGSVSGTKGYHTIEEIDPKGEGRRVGAGVGEVDPTPNNMRVEVHDPVMYQVTSRIVAETDPVTKTITFYEFDKDVSVSGCGRTTKLSVERRRIICTIPYAKAKDKPLPYEVRWGAAENSGSGAWCIYLPSLANLFAYGGAYSALSGVNAAQYMGSGWYKIYDASSSSTVVYLVVTVTDATGVATAAISVNAGTAATGQTVYNLPIAALGVDADNNHVATQFIVGAVHLGGAGGSSYTPMDEPFDIENGYVVRCVIPAPIAELTCGDYAINTNGGNIYAHVDRNTNGFTLSVDQTSRANSATHAQWVLYEYSNGEATCDRRPKILPLFDLS